MNLKYTVITNEGKQVSTYHKQSYKYTNYPHTMEDATY